MRTDVWGRRRLEPMGTLYAGEERLPNPQGGFFRPTWGMQQEGGRVATMTPGGYQTERDAPDRFSEGRQNVTMLNRPLQSGEWAATASGTRAPQVVPGINYEGVAGLQRRMMATGRGDTGTGSQDLNGDGYPDGAEVERKVKATGPDGQETVTTAKWIHRGATSNQNIYQGDPMRFSDAQRDAISQRQALAGVGRDTGRMRQFMDVRARQDRPGLEEQARELKRLEFEAPALAAERGQVGAAREQRAGVEATAFGNVEQAEIENRRPQVGTGGVLQNGKVTAWPEAPGAAAQRQHEAWLQSEKLASEERMKADEAALLSGQPPMMRSADSNSFGMLQPNGRYKWYQVDRLKGGVVDQAGTVFPWQTIGVKPVDLERLPVWGEPRPGQAGPGASAAGVTREQAQAELARRRAAGR